RLVGGLRLHDQRRRGRGDRSGPQRLVLRHLAGESLHCPQGMRMTGPRQFIPTLARRASAGFTLLELMFTVAILGALIMIAVPSFEQLFASRQTTSAAQSLAASLRKAQAEATRLNRNIEVLITTSEPTAANVASAAPAAPAAATAWMVRVQDASNADEFLAGESRERFGKGVTTAGNLSSIVFTPMGRVLDVSSGAPLMLAAPRIVQF